MSNVMSALIEQVELVVMVYKPYESVLPERESLFLANLKSFLEQAQRA